MRSIIRTTAALLLVAAAASGCGRGGPRTHPVTGKVEIDGGDLSRLAGSHVEAALAGDPSVRASGEIGPDGRFTLETLHNGDLRKGAVVGSYQARIVPSGDDRRAAKAVARRYQQFASSGLTFDVPSKGEVTLRVTAR
jgi:hypothetical protein